MTPKGLGTAGRKLWADLTKAFDFTDAEPLVRELCCIADRLNEVRKTLAREELVAADRKKHPLADLEPKLSAQYQKLWKLCGFADPDFKIHRGPGRPQGK